MAEGIILCQSSNVLNFWWSSYSCLQVLSWKPRALYFPSFATPEQCNSIIGMAKPQLRPSTLALRKGETDESTKGTRTRYLNLFSFLFPAKCTRPYNSLDQWVCHILDIFTYGNSSGVFISASDDETGTLDVIEWKIARATMIPPSHGEVIFCHLNIICFMWPLFLGQSSARVKFEGTWL